VAGSPPPTNTIGTVVVAALAASATFAESLVSSSRRIIVAGVSVKSFSLARPTSHVNTLLRHRDHQCGVAA
jgi:hypothetical protein